jgi:transglutaminase-like putative cysteine protease
MRQVGCTLAFDVTDDAVLALQVAPSRHAGAIVDEHLRVIRGDGWTTPAPTELAGDHGGRVHVVDVGTGRVTIDFAATLDGVEGANPSPDDAFPPRFDRLAAVVALRQSRYCPSDTLAGFATVEFAAVLGAGPGEIAQQVASWVFERLAYAPGSSGPLDTALDTLASGSGVCRDFAHLTITMCRALGVPARLVSVYAPGISPMDFHAVVEVLTPIGWAVVDPTRLAPRSALVRIATGRDAADTAFATTLRGRAELVTATVFASSDGDLPADDHAAPVALP